MPRAAPTRRGVVLAIVALTLTVVSCGAANEEPGEATAVRVQAAVDDFLDGRDIPGASVAVRRGGELITAVSGYADLDRREPIGTRDQFLVASITKTYLAALALALDAEDVLSLDDSIDRWLSDDARRLDLDGVTMRQLLSHTSGLAQTPTEDRDRGRRLTLEDVLARVPPRACAAGRCWNYADANYVVAAIVLEAATRKSLTTEMTDRFFEPLGLANTHFSGDPGAAPRHPYALVVDPITFDPVQPHQLREQLLPIVTDSRAASIVASATDLARWGHALYNGRAIGSSSLERMLDTSTMRGLPCPSACPQQYGLGVFHYRFGGREFVGHDGSSGAIVATDIKGGLTIAIVTNGGERETGRFFEAVLAALERD